MTTALFILLAAVFAFLAWRDFRFALAAMFGLLPTYLLRFSVGPVPSTLLEIFILTLAVTWILKADRNIFSLFTSHFSLLGRWRVPVLLGLGAACIAASYAPDTWSALGILKAYYVEPTLVLLMLRSTFTKDDDWRAAGMALIISGTVVAVLALLQYATGVSIPAPWDLENRTTSVFDFPNAVGLYLAPIVSMLLVSTFASRSPHRLASCLLSLASSAVMLAAIITSETEAALVAIPAALLVALLMSQAKAKTRTTALVVSIALGTAAFSLSEIVRKKLLLGDVSGQARLAMWHETLAFLAQHPFLGAGLSGFPTAISAFHDPTFYEIFQYPHNVLLNVWVELGALGVIVAMLFAGLVVRTAWQHRTQPLVLAAFAALLTMAIHGLVDVPFFKNDLAVMTAGFVGFLVCRDTQKTAITPSENAR